MENIQKTHSSEGNCWTVFLEAREVATWDEGLYITDAPILITDDIAYAGIASYFYLEDAQDEVQKWARKGLKAIIRETWDIYWI